MRRRHVREQVVGVTRLLLGRDEFIRSCSAVWATECGGRVPLLLRGRSLHYVAVTDRRLIIFRAPRRRGRLTTQSMLLAKRYLSFTLERARRFGPMFQLRLRDASGREISLEFRPRDRGVGRDLMAMLTARRELPRVTGVAGA